MATDARINVGLPKHPKTKKLIRRLGPGAGWSLVCLFLWAASDRPDGDLSGMTGEDIELAGDWSGDDGAFVAGLVDVGFLDQTQSGYMIHDWAEHNPWAAGSKDRSEASTWAALCKRYGKKGAADRMPNYAERMRPAHDAHAGGTQPQCDTSAPSPIPSPSPLPSPSPIKERAATSEGAAREETQTQGHTPTPAGLVCRAMKTAGLQSVNPGDPRLLALIEQGATLEEFTGLAEEAVSKAKGFAWVLSVLHARREEAAKIKLAPPPEQSSEPWFLQGRKAVETKAIEHGLQAWDECEQWALYVRRVRAQVERKEAA